MCNSFYTPTKLSIAMCFLMLGPQQPMLKAGVHHMFFY